MLQISRELVDRAGAPRRRVVAAPLVVRRRARQRRVLVGLRWLAIALDSTTPRRGRRALQGRESHK